MAIRIGNRSTCASGNGYVPSYSIGFCVAITMTGRASWFVTPSVVTCCSCMHSSRAACVFGDARLISSTSNRFANTGPGRNSNSFDRWLKTFTPVTSDGNRSGVNCIREKDTSSERASALASIVFPTPGKSSRMRWPSPTRQRTHRLSVSSGACTTRPRLSTIERIVSAAGTLSTLWLSGLLTQQLLGCIYDRRRDLVLRSLGDPTLFRGTDEDDFVVAGVEADVAPRDVVVDHEVDVLLHQFLARAREAAVSAVGREADQHLAVRSLLPERAQDVGSWLEGHLPRLLVLRALAGCGFCGPVVGDGCRHQDDVCVTPGQRFVEHGRGRGGVHDLDATRWRDCEIRGEQRDLGSSSACFLGKGYAHPAGGAVTEESDR